MGLIDVNAQRTLDELMEEGNKFKALRSDWQRSAYPEQGTPVFIVCKKWVDKYKEYIFYRELQMGRSPNFTPDHLTTKFPGQITNNDLCELQEDKFLVGTGTLKDFPSEVVDSYLKKSVRETVDYETFSEAMWNHCVKRFGAEKEIKRFYIKG